MPDALADFPFDPSPRTDHCERCGSGPEGDLRFMIVRGRDRYLGRTVCDTCSEEILEELLVSGVDPQPA